LASAPGAGGVAILAGLISALYPALVLANFRPAFALRTNRSGLSGSSILHTTLVVLQFAVSIGLGISALVVFEQVTRRRDFRAAHPDVNPTKQRLEKQYSDFREVDGMATAFLEHQVELDTGSITQVTIVDQMTYNQKLDPKIFDRSYKLS
jgi:hypothetical protein